MKFTESWLRELIDFPVSVDELAVQLTMAGLEIESVTACRPAFSGVVAGRVIIVDTVTGSDKLKHCVVDVGSGDRRTVICGASNVQAGGSYPLALPGAVLPGNKTIQETTLYGVISQGMFCSGAELGLSEIDSGLFEIAGDAIPGTALDEYLRLNDVLIEVSLTPNRGDCLGMIGLAKEVAVLNNMEFKAPVVLTTTPTIADTRDVILDVPVSCPRYCGRIIDQIDISKKIPVEISERLRLSGIRSINPVVDLANYVMLETGQPMHVFDNECLKGDIHVRLAGEGEKILLLDGETRELFANTLVIADESGPVAMAGIMGGLDSAVSNSTNSIFIESAYFDPQVIMGRARQYGMHTDASHRYERGVDPALAPLAMDRLTTLIMQVCGGKPGQVNQVSCPAHLPQSKSIKLRLLRIEHVLGVAIPESRIRAILTQLGFNVTVVSDGQYLVKVPTSRFDITIEADLIEEIARIHGYQNIASTSPVIKMQMKGANTYAQVLSGMSAVLVARGYRECISYSFVDPALQNLFRNTDSTETCLLNPISHEMSVMRLSLWPGLIQSLLYNIKRQQLSVRLFETGKVYPGELGMEEHRVIGGLIYGNRYKIQWDIDNISCDFYDLKSDVEAVLTAQSGYKEIEFLRSKQPGLHPGQCAQVIVNNRNIGYIGMLHPTISRHLAITQPVFLFQLNLELISADNSTKFTKISKYPSIKRDISIVVDETVAAAELMDTIRKASNEVLTNLELFDVYRGEGIDSGKKSLALGLTFQRSSSTLTDEEADVAISDILKSLHEKYGAILRE